MARYRRKPEMIEAVKITRTITIETAKGSLIGNPGDYLITDKHGEQYPCDARKFEQTYERVKDGKDVTTFIKKVVRKVKKKSKELFMKTQP
ncbi:hypothetical protein JCM9140_3591 [Halalkalibacter wakoensis JCM 9140]|uniref:Uncharacterized protein n=1 Tax=Halalkalibacter wakoensis JCM 9140 TaxID=1236970 RepID=W4Q7W8_9BACI|nr:hypothetical protein [Halalkalibacter wakoensis]GAE27444.1 hypothetical protein JCM9140_3591 [Halalkalibacter wakoensis JCM 9140]